jgi:hypothetical protein
MRAIDDFVNTKIVLTPRCMWGNPSSLEHCKCQNDAAGSCPKCERPFCEDHGAGYDSHSHVCMKDWVRP